MTPRSIRPLIGCLIAASLLACGKPAEELPAPAAAPEIPAADVFDPAELDRFIAETMLEQRIPGLAAAIVKNGAVAWSRGYGQADLERQIPMTPDTIVNVASVSKTVTNAAVLQLWEEGRIDLDADVNRYLPFAVRHPRHPQAAITARHLLTHTSAIADGSAYEASYACGDPAVALGDWLASYLVPGGETYSAEENFLAEAPGENFSYSNVGFGLAGYLVEVVSGTPFADYTRERVFAPLAMHETAWHLADVDPSRHAVPYAWLDAGETVESPLLAGVEIGVVRAAEGYVAHCLYSFYNYPDGLVRTSVSQLARFLLAHMGDGSYDGGRILRPETVEAIWETQLERDRLGREGVQGLTWWARELESLGRIWGHSGGDPGVSTYMLFRPADGVGILVFANRSTRLGPFAERLFAAAALLP